MSTSLRSEAFQKVRPRLLGLAYRMTGSLADAEDIVQDAWLRWVNASPDAMDAPEGYLVRIVTRLCIDHARSARSRREVYVGPWLPEPVSDLFGVDAEVDPGREVELADDLSMALMLVLERLSPLERAAFLLHDIFDVGFKEVATVLGRTPEACRQLASRARRRVTQARSDTPVSAEVARAFAERFYRALQTGDLAGFAHELAEDAELVADGGGKVYAALNPIRGREKIVRFLAGLAAKFGLPKHVQAIALNGGEGFLIVEAEGGLQAWSIERNRAGRVHRIYLMRNPDKLGHLRKLTST